MVLDLDLRVQRVIYMMSSDIRAFGHVGAT